MGTKNKIRAFRLHYFCTILYFTTLTLTTHTHTGTPLYHVFYIVNNFFSYTYSSGTELHIIVLCIYPILYCEVIFYFIDLVEIVSNWQIIFILEPNTLIEGKELFCLQ